MFGVIFYWVFGYAFAFGKPGMWFSGYWWFALSYVADTECVPSRTVPCKAQSLGPLLSRPACPSLDSLSRAVFALFSLYLVVCAVPILPNTSATNVLFSRFSKFVFQYAIASIVPLIVSGAIAERVRFECYLVFSACCSGTRTCTVVQKTTNTNKYL